MCFQDKHSQVLAGLNDTNKIKIVIASDIIC